MQRRTFIHQLSGAASLPLIVPTLLKPAKHHNQPVIKPKKLQSGDTIGLVTPATFITEEELRHAEEKIHTLGFKIYYSPNMLVRKGYLGGTDTQRAADLNQMFANESIDAIWCGRGGYGSARILPYLDYELIRSNPKPFIGYSDITSLHYGIHAKTGLITFHGPVAKEALNPFTRRYFNEVLVAGKSSVVFENEIEAVEPVQPQPAEIKPEPIEGIVTTPLPLETIVPGEAEGVLIGGNLSLVSAIAGTAYDIDMRGKIVFLEDVGEIPARLDRMLTQLLLTEDKLPAAAGVVLGTFADCEPDDLSKSLSLSELIHDRLSALDVPVLSGLSFGHIKKNFFLPFGVNVKLDTQRQTLTMLEKAVQL